MPTYVMKFKSKKKTLTILDVYKELHELFPDIIFDREHNDQIFWFRTANEDACALLENHKKIDMCLPSTMQPFVDSMIGHYEILDLDVWGNDNDGWEINNIFPTGNTIIIDPYDDVQIIRSLKHAGYINQKLPPKNFEIEGEPEFRMFVEYTSRRMGHGYPVYHLRRKED